MKKTTSWRTFVCLFVWFCAILTHTNEIFFQNPGTFRASRVVAKMLDHLMEKQVNGWVLGVLLEHTGERPIRKTKSNLTGMPNEILSGPVYMSFFLGKKVIPGWTHLRPGNFIAAICMALERDELVPGWSRAGSVCLERDDFRLRFPRRPPLCKRFLFVPGRFRSRDEFISVLV